MGKVIRHWTFDRPVIAGNCGAWHDPAAFSVTAYNAPVLLKQGDIESAFLQVARPWVCGYQRRPGVSVALITRERGEHIQILLDAADRARQAVIAGHPVDHRQRIRAFGQSYLELRLRGTRGAVEVVGLPSDDELPVGRSSQRLGKDTAAWAGTHTFIGNQVGIIRGRGYSGTDLAEPDPGSPARTLPNRTVCCRAQ